VAISVTVRGRRAIWAVKAVAAFTVVVAVPKAISTTAARQTAVFVMEGFIFIFALLFRG
jgi:CelD/BcsL family acetyltransferase involved in cellulose biosynthesis